MKKLGDGRITKEKIARFQMYKVGNDPHPQQTEFLSSVKLGWDCKYFLISRIFLHTGLW